MNYKTINIPASTSGKSRSSVLVIYTGGTFGMVYESKGKQLIPFDFEYTFERLPELHGLDIDLTFLSLHEPIDSSDITPGIWQELAAIVRAHYHDYAGFVILHGTDTMAYTASALSYIFDNINKPVILTGAQLPIGIARSDARENLLAALEIAAQVHPDGRPIISEVCIYFNSYLFRGNRAKKKESSDFNAFHSENYPFLANAGVRIEYNEPYLKPFDDGEVAGEPLRLHAALDTDVMFLKLFPGLQPQTIRQLFQTPSLKGVVMETYGSGNTPGNTDFLTALREAVDGGLLLFNVTQCDGGRVTQGQYKTSQYLKEMGIISGADITAEAAITKMMYVLGKTKDPTERKYMLATPLRGEMTLG